MSTIETYKREIEAELDLARETIFELKAKIRSFSDVERIQSVEEVEEIEKIASDIRTKISELNEDMKDSWEQIRSDIDNSRDTINKAFERLNRALV